VYLEDHATRQTRQTLVSPTAGARVESASSVNERATSPPRGCIVGRREIRHPPVFLGGGASAPRIAPPDVAAVGDDEGQGYGVGEFDRGLSVASA
jgi:hypothetical protein